MESYAILVNIYGMQWSILEHLWHILEYLWRLVLVPNSRPSCGRGGIADRVPGPAGGVPGTDMDIHTDVLRFPNS